MELLTNPVFTAGLTIVSLVSLILGIVLTPWIVSRLDDDFFLARHKSASIPWLISRNIVGLAVFLTGVALLFLPGQGLVTIILGLAIMNFPYKRQLLRQIAERPFVWRTLNKWRRRHGKAEFLYPH